MVDDMPIVNKYAAPNQFKQMHPAFGHILRANDPDSHWCGFLLAIRCGCSNIGGFAPIFPSFVRVTNGSDSFTI